MITASEKGLVVCRYCGTLAIRDKQHRCTVCNARLDMRLSYSLQKVWAFWLAGLIAYIPGNLYPIMVTETIDESTHSTIIGGVISLLNNGYPGIAFVIFFASVVIPISKFFIIALLAVSLQSQKFRDEKSRHRAHRLIELVGRWSMIDVFVVAALSALIQLGVVMTILPGTGVMAFAAAVILTMFSANALDTRLFWDHTQRPSKNGNNCD